MQERFSKIFLLFRDTFQAWIRDRASRQAAALAFFTILSLPPLLIIVITIAGSFFGQAEIQQQIIDQVRTVTGSGGADLIKEILNATYDNGGGILATFIGVLLLIFAATNIFAQLKTTLDWIWGVQPEESETGGPVESALGFIRQRLRAALAVFIAGFLLLAAQITGIVIPIVIGLANELDINTGGLLNVANLLVSIGLVTLVVALIFRYLPEAQISWQDVLVGSLFTALLLTLGQRAIGLYLEVSNVASAYGVAGSLIALLLWIFYSANILIFGAEFTQAYASHFGSKIRPSSHDDSQSSSATRTENRAPDQSTGTVLSETN